MFTFDGRIDRSTFLRSAIWRIGLFLASVVAFPFLLWGLAIITACGSGACGALGVVVAMVFKPLAFIIFVFSFVGISMRRVRDVGAPSWIGLFIPLLLATSYSSLVFGGAPWGFAFSAGALFTGPSYDLFLALFCIAILCIVPSQNNDRSGNPFGPAGWIAFSLCTFVAFFAILGLAIIVTGPSPAVRKLLLAVQPLWKLTPFAKIALSIVLGWIAWRYRTSIPEAVRLSPTTSSSEMATNPAVPIKLLLLVAFGLASVAFIAIMSNDSSGSGWLFAYIVQFSTIVLPTMAIYFFLLLGLWLMATRRTLASAGLLALSILPFANWTYAHVSAARDHRKEIAGIARIPVANAPRIPETIVYENQQVAGINAAWTINGVNTVILKGAHGSQLVKYERPQQGERNYKQSNATSLPSEYLLLKIGRASEFAKDRTIYGAGGGPFELRYINSGRNDLVSVDYRVLNPAPSIIPVLTTIGWFRGSNIVTADEVNDKISAFLRQALRT